MFYRIARFGHRPLAVSTIQEAVWTIAQKMAFGGGLQVMLSEGVL